MARLLIASPRFHEYWRAIADAFSARGHEVRVLRYDEPTTLAGRLRNQALHRPVGSPLARIAGERLGASMLAAARAWRPERILTIKGDLLGDAWWDGIAQLGVPRIAWFYDELRAMRHPRDRVERMGAVATYSPHDVAELSARGVRTRFVPLAFDHRTRVARRELDAITFIGARYPNRERLLAALHRAGLPVRAVGDDWAGRPSDVLRPGRWTRHGIPSLPGVPRAEAFGLMAGSPATLNIHGDQAGCFTMRTFEAPGAGGLQLVDRPDIEAFYDPGREVLAFATEDEAIELSRWVLAHPAAAQRIREAGRARTLAEHTFDHRVADVEELWD